MSIAVLMMAHGAAASVEEIPTYLKDIRDGRAVSDALLAQVTERYKAIGGKSPLLDITRKQATALEVQLGHGFATFIGMRHSSPRILDAVGDIVRKDYDTIVALPLTPFRSKMSVGAYLKRLNEAVEKQEKKPRVLAIEGWSDQPAFIDAWAAKVRAGVARFDASERGRVGVIFSAHSLPERVLIEKDPYPEELRKAVDAIARRASLQSWEFAYQSRGQTEEPWLGPDVSEVMKRLGQEGKKNILLVPVGFISDHMETLYDDDILYKAEAQRLSLRYERAESLNDDPMLIRAMADAVRRATE